MFAEEKLSPSVYSYKDVEIEAEPRKKTYSSSTSGSLFEQERSIMETGEEHVYNLIGNLSKID